MAAPQDVLASAPQSSAVDEAGKWFWNFFKNELTPYPGRLLIVSRITISATIVMILVMTFQLPGGFLGAIFTILLSRENPTTTFMAGLRTIIASFLAVAYTAVSLLFLLDDPLTHFLWVAGSLFLSFFLLRVVADYATAVAFGFVVTGAISLWDANALNVNRRLENTLWLLGVVALGVVVTVIVEYVFRSIHPATDLAEGLDERLATVAQVLRSTATGQPLAPEWEKKLSLYATIGTSRLRRLIIRSQFGPHYKEQMSTVISLIGRLIDTTANFRQAVSARAFVSPEDQARCLRLADKIMEILETLSRREIPGKTAHPSPAEPSELTFLATMERTVALIPEAFSGSESVQKFVKSPLDEADAPRFFVSDGFSNPDHVQFALRGTLAAMAAYMTYNAIDWQGLSTAVATCFITALTTIGSSRQKQILRLAGTVIGGFVIGMGAQIFLLPYLDTITGFALLFAAVTAISGWIGVSSTRLSYLGVQMALAFFVINLQEFTIQTSLSVARDRVFGVMLGLLCMWLLYDRLGVKNSLDEMESVFARNLILFAEMAEELLVEDQVAAVRRMRQLRDQINAGFQAVTAQADAVLFEFGPSRHHKMRIREDVRRWQPSVRALLQVQITFAQYRVEKPVSALPAPVHAADVAFEKDLATVMRAMASEVSGHRVESIPDIGASAQRVQEEVRKSYQERGVPISPEGEDVISLTASLAGILQPLYQDIRATFAAHNHNPDAPGKTLAA